MSPARNRSRNASRVAASQTRRCPVTPLLPLSSIASRQTGRRKLVGGLLGQVRPPLLYAPCSSSTARSVAVPAGTARSWKASRNRGPSLCSTGQAFGCGDARRELLPTNGGHDGAVQVGVCLLSRDQGGAQLGEQAHLIVGGTGVAKDSVFLACLGAAEHAADRAVEQ